MAFWLTYVLGLGGWGGGGGGRQSSHMKRMGRMRVLIVSFKGVN